MENLSKYREFLIRRTSNIYDGKSTKTLLMNTSEREFESFRLMLKKTGLDKKIRITSAERKAGLAGKAGSRSWHTKRDKYGESLAYDLVSLVPGKSVKDLIIENNDMYNYVYSRGARYIDERSKKALLKYGSTGAHEHISFGGNGSREGILLLKDADGNKVMTFAPDAYENSIRTNNPILTYLETPIGTSYIPYELNMSQTILEEPTLLTEIPIVELPEVEVVPTKRPTFDLPIFIELENPFLTTLELPILRIPNAVELLNLLSLEYINRERALLNDNILYNSPYLELLEFIYGKELALLKLKLAIEDLRLKESLANISALGGSLFDPITNTFTPNNKVGDFNSKSIIPQVRY